MKNKKRMVDVLFMGSLVPDRPEFLGSGHSRAGNLAQAGFVEGLRSVGVRIEVLSAEIAPAYPRSKVLFCRRKHLDLGNGLQAVTIPSLNILILRELGRGLYAFFAILFWAFRNRTSNRFLLTYNIYTPPVPFVLLAARLSKSRLVPILFDMGMPPGDLGWLRMAIYKCVERVAKWVVPRCDGQVVINKNIASKYVHGENYLLIDGGITDGVVSRLPTLQLPALRKGSRFKILCAGSLWRGNGGDLLLEAMQFIQDSMETIPLS